MRFSRTELEILDQIAQGNMRISGIAAAMKKSKPQIYRSGKKLIEKNIIIISRSNYEVTRSAPASLLVQLLREFSSAIEPLSDSGIEVLKTLFEPRSIREIMQQSGIGRTQVFKKISQARAISLVRKRDKKYSLNEKLWTKAIDFLKELTKYEDTVDSRVPGSSVIYYKNDKEILFSSMEEINAALTAFSAYEEYGIKILSNYNYYYLPQRKLSKKDVFQHSLYIAAKDNNVQHIILVAIFYAKYKKELSGIKHIIRENLDKIFEGERIPGYPSLAEIKDRAEVYDIKI